MLLFSGKPKKPHQSGFPPGKKKDAENQDDKNKGSNHLKFPDKTQHSRTVASSEPTIKTESRNNQIQYDPLLPKDSLGITAVGLTQIRQNKTPGDQILDRKGKIVEDRQNSGLPNSNQMHEDRPNTKSSLSTKLRLLLNKSAQKENEDPENEQAKQKRMVQKKKRHSYFRNRYVSERPRKLRKLWKIWQRNLATIIMVRQNSENMEKLISLVLVVQCPP